MCYDDQARPPEPPGARQPARGEAIELQAEDGNRFAGFLALPSGEPSARVLILPDVRGLHRFYEELALRFAETGVAALAMDYFGRTAGIGNRDESFEFWPHVQQIKPETLLADVRASLSALRARAGGDLADVTVGFCLGGTFSLMCGTADLSLSGVVGFYAGLARDLGNGTLLDRASSIKVPVLGLFGGDDPHIPPDQVAALDTNLDEAGVEHEIVSYPGAPHSFFDRRAEDFAEASADAWARVLGFIAGRSVHA